MINSMHIFAVLTLFLLLQPSAQTPVKMRAIWLNNGGGTLTWEDWITLKISTPNMNHTIVCADGRGYTYHGGTTRRFSNLWFPV